MTDSVNRIEQVTLDSGLPLDRRYATEQADKINLSYSAKVSSEQVSHSAAAFDAIDLPVPLDAPPSQGAEVQEDVVDFASNAQLNGLKEVVAYFNRAFNLDALDFADTASILLMVKGMVSDMKALSGAENIDSELKAQETSLEQLVTYARNLVSNKVSLQSATANKEQAIVDRDEKITLRDQKQETYDADPDADGAADLLDTIQGLQAEINQLNTDISNYTTEITTLTEDIKLAEYRLKEDITTTLERTFYTTKKIRQRYDPSAVRTGENKRAETAMLNKEEAVLHELLGREQGEMKQMLYAQGKSQIDDQVKREANSDNQKRVEASRTPDQLTLLPPGIEALLASTQLTTLDNDKKEIQSPTPEKPVTLPPVKKEEVVVITQLFEMLLSGFDEAPVPEEVQEIKALEEVLPGTELQTQEEPVDKVPEDIRQAFDSILKSQANERARIDALHLESHVLAMVAQAEKDRQATEGRINKNSLV